MQARLWLRANGYEDIATIIEEIMREWRVQGKGTRRNWWDVLAGRRNGAPCIIAGRTFPVLRVAQIRKGMPVTANAIVRNENEVAPEVKPVGRWGQYKDEILTL